MENNFILYEFLPYYKITFYKQLKKNSILNTKFLWQIYLNGIDNIYKKVNTLITNIQVKLNYFNINLLKKYIKAKFDNSLDNYSNIILGIRNNNIYINKRKIND